MTSSARPSVSAGRKSIRNTWSPATRPLPANALSISYKDFTTAAHVSPRDGRVHISLNALHPSVLASLPRQLADAVEKAKEEERKGGKDAPLPRLNIVIMVIGSRGDVQPFIAIAKGLMEGGHRVRLATHGAFREFVREHGVEFFDVGGDPGELMAFMVKNPGLVPGVEAIKQGEIAKRREQMYEMFQGFWRACIEPSDKYRPRNDNASIRSEVTSSTHNTGATYDHGEADVEPFIADAIIANPPSFAHVHCAEKLGIPLHLMFTFPYSPTQEIAHPLAFIANSNMGSEYTNAISYPMVEMMTWQGLGDLVNRFREKTLRLEPVATLWAPGMISRLKVPYTYMWSPALIPKPKDWGRHIEVTGFVFLDQSKDYEPPEDLQKFLDAGEPPVYIGFGSIVVDDPNTLTHTLFEAIKATGVRALVSKGWGGLGGADASDNVFMLGNTPHDWLFSKVSAVVHHGGAGTTAIGLFHGKPTMVVPFFGDQPFWGAMIHNAGAGPEPVPHKDLTAENLAEGIKTLLSDECQNAAKAISRRIKEEDGDGAKNAVASFYRGLTELDLKGKRGLGKRGKTYGEGGPMGPGEGKSGTGGPGIRCDILQENVAVWRVRRTRVRLSVIAAAWLVEKKFIDWKDLRLLRHTEWNDYDGPGEPLSGGFSALFGSIAGVAKGIIGVPYTLIKGAKRFDDEVDIVEELKPATTRRRFRDRFRKAKREHQDDEDWKSTSHSSTHRKHKQSIPHDLAAGTKKSLKRIVRSSVRAPLDVSLAVAQGFHNAPRLYGDEVRRPQRITGFHSGMRAAGKGLALGIYDGFTGLVTQPYKGVQTEGLVGAIKGVGKGFGGLVFKTQAGLAGCIAFPLKGIHREARKGRDRKVLWRIMEARKRQGWKELERFRQGVEGNGEALLEERMKFGWEKVLEERRKRTERATKIGREIERRRERRLVRREEEMGGQAAGMEEVGEENGSGERERVGRRVTSP
ncbi:hypothetical protein FN846DRAFT_710716 [Sphaerosporella brunnea]|uniref:Uncharacterized protein n=1 Tax=Sphaerosporella brunnea TaxID=1250544 RepID=A0A5J5EY09_9PEZI|nr:hypothetical protein FN846DRAFT_710716 [Sphaerosporella brunnea]